MIALGLLFGFLLGIVTSAAYRIVERATQWAGEMERYQQMTGRSQVPDLPEPSASGEGWPRAGDV